MSAILGERLEAQILKFNAPPPPPPTHSVCHVRLIANFLLKLYFIHISKDILLLRAQNAIKQCKWYFSKKPQFQGLRSYKLVNLSSCMAAQLPLILCMISKNSDLGVGGNVKFFTEAIFILMNTKFTHLNQINYPLTICIHTKLLYGTVFKIWSNLCRKVAPRKNPEKQAKKWNFLSSASKYQKYTKFTSRYMFLWMTNTMKLVSIPLRITKDVKIQGGRQLWLKKIVFGIR